MAKLILRRSCYAGIEGIKRSELQNIENHKQYAKEANKRIEKNRIRYAVAYKNAGSYFEQ